MNSSLYVQCLSISLLLLLVGRGLCDDRQMGWNKAHGLWGKRSGSTQQEVYNQHKRPENWAKLNTLWGKRSEVEPLTNYGEWSKRAQWQMANGLWGR